MSNSTENAQLDRANVVEDLAHDRSPLVLVLHLLTLQPRLDPIDSSGGEQAHLHECQRHSPCNESGQGHAGDHDSNSDEHSPAKKVVEGDEGERDLEDTAPCDLSVSAEVL